MSFLFYDVPLARTKNGSLDHRSLRALKFTFATLSSLIRPTLYTVVSPYYLSLSLSASFFLFLPPPPLSSYVKSAE